MFAAKRKQLIDNVQKWSHQDISGDQIVMPIFSGGHLNLTEWVAKLIGYFERRKIK